MSIVSRILYVEMSSAPTIFAASLTIALASHPNLALGQIVHDSAARQLIERSRIVAPFRPISAYGRAGTCPSAPVAFVSDEWNNVVYELDTTGDVCATLTGFNGPTGISVDARGNLYVANGAGRNSVEVQSSTGALVDTFNDPNIYGRPMDIAVDGKGDLAVTDGVGVVFYGSGSTSPTGMASNPSVSPRFCAFDRKGNLIFDDDPEQPDAPVVGIVFRGNLNNMQAVMHPLNGDIFSPGGVQVLNTAGPYGTLAIMANTRGQSASIYTYKSLSYPNLGPPTITPLAGSGYAFGFSFSSSGTLAFVADFGAVQAQLYRYPSGVLVQNYTDPNAGFIGAAINPAASL